MSSPKSPGFPLMDPQRAREIVSARLGEHNGGDYDMRHRAPDAGTPAVQRRCTAPEACAWPRCSCEPVNPSSLDHTP